MGGAPCLLPDLAKLPQDVRDTAIRVSANEHGARLGPVDYCVYADSVNQNTKEDMVERIRRYHSGPLVSHQFREGVARLHDWRRWRIAARSGDMAVLWAWLLGCSPIIVCGIEHYTGGTYFHDLKAKSSGFHKKDLLKNFQTLFFQLSPVNMRAVSGPLKKLVGTYQADERFEPQRRHHRRDVFWATQMKQYEWVASHSLSRVGPQLFAVGDRVWLTMHEASDGVKFEWLKKVSDEVRNPVDCSGIVR